MTCYSPLKAFKPLSNLDGGRLVFNSKYALNPTNPTTVPCGNCIGCRVDRSRDWAIRCMHEAEMHPENSFITLTYSDEHLPENYSVDVRTWQLFMYRLRKHLRSTKVRFFACGEYGEQTLRPHYHALIFNHSFPDKVLHKTNAQGDRLYTSETLSRIWPYGFNTIGDVNYKTAAYCARYVLKKINGERATTHYLRTHPTLKTIVKVEPEFCVQSRNPGLGATWYDKYKTDAFPSDFLVSDGKPHSVPKYYLKKLQKEETPVDEYKLKEKTTSQKIKRQRSLNAKPRAADNTPRRLRDREEVKKSAIKTLKRTL